MSSDKVKLYNQQLNSLHKEFLKAQESVIGPQGWYGDYIDEAKPSFNKADCEKIIQGKTNAHVMFGRNRDGSLASTGFTQAAAIDLVAGLASSNQKLGASESGPPDSDVSVNPNFFTDAARVYITQRGDIDASLGLAQGSEVAREARHKSAVGIKGDHLRLAARNHIKIVTGRAQIEGGDERNSQGQPNERTGRIDLIAGNYTEDEKVSMFSFLSSGGLGTAEATIKKLQPIPKGDNLAEVLTEIFNMLSDVCHFTLVNSIDIATLAGIQNSHWHVVAPVAPGLMVAGPQTSPPSVYAATMVSPILKGIGDKLSFQFNLAVGELNYLKPSFSPKYINSSHVNLT